MTDAPIKDASADHWVYRLPQPARAFAQLSRLDRPVGYWLLTLPGWIGLAFASLSHGFAQSDLKWAALILIGAIAMRGAGCTYNDIVDQDLDARVERTALRPLPAGTVTTKQAWIWLFAQCAVGLIVLLCLPRLAQIIALCSIPLVAAYPFMKRITWWPQVWLGLTFNWAVLVAYAAKTGHSPLSGYILQGEHPAVLASIFVLTLLWSSTLYLALVFWTVGYDTIYACQDTEDDALIGVRSTARKFGAKTKYGVAICYSFTLALLCSALMQTEVLERFSDIRDSRVMLFAAPYAYFPKLLAILSLIPFALHLAWQVKNFKLGSAETQLNLFKSNKIAAVILIMSILLSSHLMPHLYYLDDNWTLRLFFERPSGD